MYISFRDSVINVDILNSIYSILSHKPTILTKLIQDTVKRSQNVYEVLVTLTSASRRIKVVRLKNYEELAHWLC